MALDYWEQRELEHLRREQEWYERYLANLLHNHPNGRHKDDIIAETQKEYQEILGRKAALEAKESEHGE